MNKTRNLKPSYKYISLTFFKANACAYQESLKNPFRFIDDKIPAGLKYEKFLCWGYSDILTIFLSESPKLFVDLQKIYPANNHIYEDRYYSGILLQPKEFNLSIVNKLPLLGISFIKFNDILYQGVRENKLLPLIEKEIWGRIQRLSKRYKNISIYLIFSYGWEDLILLIFNKRYDEAKELIFEIREEFTFKSIRKYLSPLFFRKFKKARHILITTYTNFGVYFRNPSKINYSLKKLQKEIDKRDKMLIDEVKFQVRPGHVDKAKKEIGEDKNIKSYYSIGRHDITLKFCYMKIDEFFEFYFKKVWLLLSKKNSPILSTQTSFMLPHKRTEKIVPCEKNINISSLTQKEGKFIKKLLNTIYLPDHSAVALGNVLVASRYLEDSFFIKGTMGSLIQFINIIKKEINKGKNKLNKYETALRIMRYLSMCFIDRFRGSYPLGESFFTPLITYKGSFQKQLIFIDYICQIISDSLRKTLDSYTKDLKQHKFCSFITPTISPAIHPLTNVGYNLGILAIPLDTIFTPKFLFYIFHEIGHSTLLDLFAKEIFPDFSNEIFSFPYVFPFIKNKEKREFNLRAEACRIIEDIVCDYILLVLGFNGKKAEFINYMKEYSDKIFKGRINPEILFRIEIVKKIYAHFKNKRIERNIESFLKKFKNIFKNKISLDQLKTYSFIVKFIKEKLKQQSFEFLRILTNKWQNNKDHIEILQKFLNTRNPKMWFEIYEESRRKLN